MGREKRGSRERDASRQSDREEQYGGMNEQGQGGSGQQRYVGGGYGQGVGEQRRNWQEEGQDNWQDQQYRGSGSRGQGFGTGGRHQGEDPDLGSQFGSEARRGDVWGTGGHGSGTFGQSASDQGRNYGQGNYYQAQEYGGQVGQSGRSGQGGGRYGPQGYQGGSSGQGLQGGQGYESGRPIGYAGRGPKGYRRSDDRIREDVSEELTRHPGIDASEIEVRVENGEVTLMGTVESRQAKRMAEDCVEQCSGVKEVQNQLRVNRQGSVKGSEEPRSRSSPARGQQ